MSAEPMPEPRPATAADLGHPVRYPIFVDDVWRSCCSCHWWVEVEAPEGVETVTPYYQDESVTLYHGDCQETDTWLEADVLVTDPPYGMAYRPGGRKYVGEKFAIAGDESTALRDAVLDSWGARPALVFGFWNVPRPTATRHVLTWWKRSVGPGGGGDMRLPWGVTTEDIYVIGEGWVGRRRPNVIETFDRRQTAALEVGHPTPKPVGLMEQLIECSPPGVIADPFAGGGATLLAARNAGRKVVGVEIEERYCEVIARRFDQAALFGGAA